MAALLASIRGISSVANIFIEQLETKAAADWSRLFHQGSVNEVKSAISKLNKIAFIFWLSVMLIIWKFDQIIVTVVLGATYGPYAYLLDIAWVSYGTFYISRIYGIQYRTFGDNRIEFIAGGCGLVAAVLGSYWMIPMFGLEGATWVYVLIPLLMWGSQIAFSKLR